MLTGTEGLYLSTTTQLLLTVCLVMLLWALYTRLQRFEFFRWWAWAWTAFAVYLAAATISLRLGPAWTVQKASLVGVLVFSGYLQPVLLVFGGLSWRTQRKPSRALFWGGTALAIACALICFVLSFWLRELPLVSFAVRNVSRTLALACALLFCGAVFWREFQKSRSYAAAITSIFCLAYSVDQLLYFASFSEMLSSHWHVQFPGLLEDNAALQSEIQNRQRIEEELRRSEEFSRQIIQSCPVAMVVSGGPLESVQLANEEFTNLFGYTADEIRAVEDWWPLAYPDPQYRKLVQAQWQELINKANAGSSEKLAMEARV